MEKSYFTKSEREILQVRCEDAPIFGEVLKVQLTRPLVIVHFTFGDFYYTVRTLKKMTKEMPNFFSNVLYTEVKQMY